MSATAPYTPHNIFSLEEGPNPSVPRVMIGPARYIQGDGILGHLGRYLSIVPCRRAAILISAGGERRHGPRLVASMSSAGISAEMIQFQGECSLEEIGRVAAILEAASPKVDCLVAVGGGKCVDAGKSIADRLRSPSRLCRPLHPMTPLAPRSP